MSKPGYLPQLLIKISVLPPMYYCQELCLVKYLELTSWVVLALFFSRNP